MSDTPRARAFDAYIASLRDDGTLPRVPFTARSAFDALTIINQAVHADIAKRVGPIVGAIAKAKVNGFLNDVVDGVGEAIREKLSGRPGKRR